MTLSKMSKLLASLLCLGAAVGGHGLAQCPEGGPWGDGMYSADKTDGSPSPACCLQPWVQPTAFGTTTELMDLGLPTGGTVCTSALNITEYFQAYQLGRLAAPNDCSSDCSAWGPSGDLLCCTPDHLTALAATPFDEAITSYHQVPWIPVDLCPSSAAADMLLGVDLDEQGEPQCPAGLSQSLPQQLIFGDGSETFLQDATTYVLAFHRKSNLSPVTIKFSVLDAAGNVVVPSDTLSFTMSSQSTTGRRHLLKSKGGGGSSGSRSSSYGGTSSSFSSRTPSIGRMSSSSGKSYASTTINSAGYTRYTNSKGYVVPTRTDFTSGDVSRGSTVATTTGNGAVYWGSNSYVPPSSSSSRSYYYGAPTNFGNSWYSSYRPTSYGYSGPSAWHMALPIFILSRPYGCGYHCHYHHHNRIHNEQERELEYLTLNLDCDMSMDLVMNGAFRPSDFQAPFTVNIDSVTANVGPADGTCAGNNTSLNSTSTPDSPALFATFVRMEDVEYMDSGSSRLQGMSVTLALSMLVLWQALQHF